MSLICRCWSNPIGRIALATLTGAAMGATGASVVANSFGIKTSFLTGIITGVCSGFAVGASNFPSPASTKGRELLKAAVVLVGILGGSPVSWILVKRYHLNDGPAPASWAPYIYGGMNLLDGMMLWGIAVGCACLAHEIWSCYRNPPQLNLQAPLI